MKPSDIVLDAIADVAAQIGDKSLALGMREIVTAVCLDSGMTEQEVHNELEKRLRKERKTKLSLRLINGKS